MEEKMSGIVLSSVNFNENDKILNIFTLEKGVVSAKIKGVKKAGAKLKFASEPFCFAEFLFSESAGRRIVTGASLLESFYSIREDIIKYYAGATVLEFIKKFEKEDIISPELFMLTVEGLKKICYKNTPSISLAEFILSALKLVGYGLNLNGCYNCDGEITGKTFFDYNSGGFLCEQCFNGIGREINYTTYSSLKKIESGDFTDVDVKKALKLLNFYIVNKAEEKMESLIQLIEIIN